jgi:Fur family peroxide stress response transcriptional regulator
MKTSRETKYSKELLTAISVRRHATNAELLLDLQTMFPEVSATTIHRATARLLERGKVLEAPAKHGAMRYDASTTPHDHFICNGCDGIRNIDIAESMLPTISDALGGCKITGRLVIYGTCEKCLNKGVKNENNNIQH